MARRRFSIAEAVQHRWVRHNMPDDLKTLNNRLLDMSPQVPPLNPGCMTRQPQTDVRSDVSTARPHQTCVTPPHDELPAATQSKAVMRYGMKPSAVLTGRSMTCKT